MHRAPAPFGVLGLHVGRQAREVACGHIGQPATYGEPVGELVGETEHDAPVEGASER